METEKMNKNDVIRLIYDERKYQDSLEHHTVEQDEAHSVSDWVIFMEFHLAAAKNEVYHLRLATALEEVRKIAALALACTQYNRVRGSLYNLDTMSTKAWPWLHDPATATDYILDIEQALNAVKYAHHIRDENKMDEGVWDVLHVCVVCMEENKTRSRYATE